MEIDCPASVYEYNKNVGGVDSADQFISFYRCPFRSRRWYLKLFENCLILQKQLNQPGKWWTISLDGWTDVGHNSIYAVLLLDRTEKYYLANPNVFNTGCVLHALNLNRHATTVETEFNSCFCLKMANQGESNNKHRAYGR